MLTIIIETQDDEDRLARALAPLVSAATEGFLRDVVVVDHQSRDGARVVADVAGCALIEVVAGREDHLRRAVEGARGDWLLFLSPTAAPMKEGWQAKAFAAIEASRNAGAPGRPAYLSRGRFRAGALARLLSLVTSGDGVLVSKAFWISRAERASPASAASSVSGARRGAA